MMPSVTQWIVILLIVVILFGAGKLPKIAGDVAKSIKEFKKGMRDGDEPEANEPKKLEKPADEGK